MIYKGTESEVESYSAFFDNQKLRQTELNSVLKKKGVTDVYVCGLAADVCVGKLHWKFWSALNIDCMENLLYDTSSFSSISMKLYMLSHLHTSLLAVLLLLLSGQPDQAFPPFPRVALSSHN